MKANLYTYSQGKALSSYLADNYYDVIYDTETGDLWMNGEKFGTNPVFQGTENTNIPNTYNFDTFAREVGNKFNLDNLILSTQANLPKHNVMLGYGNVVNTSKSSDKGNNFNVVIGSAYTNAGKTINGDIGDSKATTTVCYTNIFANARNEFRSPIEAKEKITAQDISAKDITGSTLTGNVSNSFVSSLGEAATLDTVLEALLTASNYNDLPSGNPTITLTTTGGGINNPEAYTGLTSTQVITTLTGVKWNDASASSVNPRWLYATDSTGKFTNINKSNYDNYKSSMVSTEGDYFWVASESTSTITAIKYNDDKYTTVIPNSGGKLRMLKSGTTVCKTAWCTVSANSEYLNSPASTYLYATSKAITVDSTSATSNIAKFGTDITGTIKNTSLTFTVKSGATFAPGVSVTLISASLGSQPPVVKSAGGYHLGSLMTFYGSLASKDIFVPDIKNAKTSTSQITPSVTHSVSVKAGFYYIYGGLSCANTDAKWTDFTTKLAGKTNNKYNSFKEYLNDIVGADKYYGKQEIFNGNEASEAEKTYKVSTISGKNKFNAFYVAFPADRINVRLLNKDYTMSGSSASKSGEESAFFIYSSDGVDQNKAALPFHYSAQAKIKIGNGDYFPYVIFIGANTDNFSDDNGWGKIYLKRSATTTI